MNTFTPVVNSISNSGKFKRTEIQKSIKKSLACLTALSIGGGVAVNTFAQERSVGLEEIVVTATRREEGLQSIPASIAAVTAAELERQGITDFKSVSESISGLTLSYPSNAINAAVYMRGVGTSGPTSVQSVSVMVDGVYQYRQGVAFTELMDIERVEVLRGPQGTLFGKNSTSGAIRIFTADPDTEEFSGKVQGVLGNLNAAEMRGIINIPIVEGKLAVRFSGYNSERDGYTDNVFLGEDTRNVDREGWRAKVLWNVTDDLQVKYTLDNHDQVQRNDEGITLYGPKALANAALFPVQLPPVSIGKYQQNVNGEVAEEVERQILNLTWNVANHTFSTISSWEDNFTFLRSDRDETAALGQVVRVVPFITASTTENRSPMDIETHEIQWASDFDGPFSYLLGYYSQDVKNLSITSIPGLFAGTSVIETDSEAFFANFSYDFNDQWGTSIGVRRDADERTGSNAIVGNNHIETFKETTYSAKLTYQYDADKMFYLSHDKGFKSGTVNREFSTCASGGACLDPDQALVDPEIAYNYEIGMKSEWLDNNLRVNAAIFLTTFEDFQVAENIPEAVTIISSNAAEVEAKGVEVEVTGVLTDNLTVNGSATYVQSEYTDYDNAPCAFLTACNASGTEQSLTGKQLDHAPEFSFNAGAEYRDSLNSVNGAEWFARVDVIYNGEQNLYVLLPDATEEDAYAVVNTRIGLESQDEWKITLWGKNLFDEDYRTVAESDGDGGLVEVPGLPRTYGVTADWFF